MQATMIPAAIASDVMTITALGAVAWRQTYTALTPAGYVEAGIARYWSTTVIDHIAEPLRALRELLRVAWPGGHEQRKTHP